MAENVILQGHDLERSILSMKVNNFLSAPFTHKYKCEVFHQDLIASFSASVFQLLTEWRSVGKN